MKLTITLSILLSLVSSAEGQTTPSENLRPSNIERVLKKEGWEIPGLPQSQALHSKDMIPEGSSIKGVLVHVTTFKPKRKFIATLPIFNLEDNGKTIVIGQQRAEVNLIFKCEINKRAFAHIVQLVEVLSDPQTGPSRYGNIFGVRYYDNDGDGVFESYELGEGYIKNLHVPDWASRRK